MSLVAVNPLETTPFISQFDPDHPDKYDPDNPDAYVPDPKKATTFQLKVIDAIFMDKYRARQPSTMKLNTNPAKRDEMAEVNIAPVTDVDMWRIGIADIENFYDRHGQLVKIELTKKSFGKDFEYVTLPDYIIQMFHPKIVSEVAAKIRDINELQEDERKNSDSPSSSDLRERSIAVRNSKADIPD